MFRLAQKLEIVKIKPESIITTMRLDVVDVEPCAVPALVLGVIDQTPVRLTLAMTGRRTAQGGPTDGRNATPDEFAPEACAQGAPVPVVAPSCR